MPEEVKLLSPCGAATPQEFDNTEYCSESVDDSSQDSSYSDRDMNRSENSGSSDESNCYKQNGHETVEIIPTRTIKTSVPKPAANPLQFVKIGPCDLYRSAQQQLQKVGEVKKPKKEVKDEMEDWQSNLDSWKCNRRKQQEHIIERVVEVKKLELEEHDRNKKRTKTFSEMMEERTSKGRKLSLPLYLEEDSDDLSDLGISSNKNVIKSPTIPEENETNLEDTEDVFRTQTEEVSEHNKTAKTEDTYESAIQGYENKMKSLSNGKVPATRKYNTRRGSAAKIEEKLSELEKIKNRSVSSTDLTESNKKQINIPKVNIFQRKEIFEKISNAEDASKKKPGDEMPPARTIKERLHSLEKQAEENASNKSKNAPLSEVSVKDRLCHINEKMQRQNSAPVPEKSTKEPCKQIKESYNTCNGTKHHGDGSPTNPEYSSDRSCSSEDYDHVQPNHFHHRSLDSLQGHDSPNGFCFERVQSLECIDCCSNYPASVLSGDTDREDSGIHTADVSSSVSQADDFDLHADTSMDVEVKSQTSSNNADEIKVDKSSHNDFHFVSQSVEAPQNRARDKDGDENDPKHLPVSEAFKTNDCGGDLVDSNDAGKRFSGVENTESRFAKVGENVDFSRSNQNADDRLSDSSDVFADKSTTSLSDTLVNTENCDTENENHQYPRLDDDDNDDEEEIPCCKREIKIERTEHVDLNSPDVTRTDVYDDGYAMTNSYKEEMNANNFPANQSRNQNCYETDSSEYASDFASNATEQRIDYVYTRNNQYLADCPNAMSSKQDTLFAFESSTAVEPPKEKPPPPPPLENSDDELEINEKKSCLRRMDSTKRIKKELRQKRSSFLGIEGFDNDSYLEPELESVKPPPDMTTFLQEERRLEKLLYRQSICSESDSTQGESRDSGVELDKNQMDENSWIPESIHSRQDSETYANTSTTSEEDEIIKKEREILEILELEEQRHYETESKNECNDLGEKLVLRLKELERQKNVPCWSHEEELLNNQRNLINQQNFIKYEEPLNQENTQYGNVLREVIKPNEPALLQQQWAGRSLQDITQEDVVAPVNVECNISQHHTDYRRSMPNIQQELTVPNHHPRVPPPIPPNKPSAHFREPAVVSKVSSPQQMSKQTLQALSAVPRSKIVATDSWVLSKKKPRQEAYNYQHWLIQEAEHRRITEYQQRHRNDNVSHGNYVNIHPDYVEHGVVSNDAQNLDSRVPHQNRSLYAHPQMLPYRNHNQYNQEKNYIKPQQKPLPDSVIQTLTQRVQNRFSVTDSSKQRRRDNVVSNQQEKMLSVSGKKKCSHCGEELGRGAAMIIESLRLFYHIDCFKCCVCCVQLGDGLMGTDVRVRNDKLHCHSCYSNDEGLKFSCV